MSHQICQNYDFGANWNSIKHLIVPEEMDKLCKFILKKWDIPYVTFSKKRSPACLFTTSDAYHQFIMDLVQDTIDKRDTRYLCAKDLKFLDKYSRLTDEQCNDDYDHYTTRYFKLMERVETKLGYNYGKQRDKLQFYIPFGRCHIWNPEFGLPLARKVCPEDNWIVRSGTDHTTIYCPEKHKVFDIIYWGIDGRYQDHAYGIPYKSRDKSLGGEDAFQRSA